MTHLQITSVEQICVCQCVISQHNIRPWMKNDFITCLII